MAEPAQLPKPVCDQCTGEGFVFQQREERLVAVACTCVRDCLHCGGQGRVYARDERGYEVLRGCVCGADPRRLSAMTGLQLPSKFVDRTLGSYRAYSTSQQ